MRKVTISYIVAAVLTRIPYISQYLSDEMYIKIIYKGYMGKKLNLNSPRTYNEKIQWLKLHDHNPKYLAMVDKIEAKKYVADIIGDEYIVPTIGVWDKFDDIDFDKLPDKFVLKCSHDSGGIVICTDKSKLNIKEAKKKINKCLRKNFYWYGREWPYKEIKPRILAEVYLEDKTFCELRDYKFFTFNGITKAMFVATDRNKKAETKFDFFDLSYKHIPLKNGHPNADEIPDKPQNFEKMIELANMLSRDTTHLRVDFYEVDGRVYFGEMTFYHWSGFTPFDPEKYDYIWGEWIKIPDNL